MVENALLNEVQDAMHKGNRAAAKEILLKLVRGDQKNPIYWLYLSAVMDSREEKISCFQNVLRLDPENEEAKKGLRLLGNVSESEALFQVEWKSPQNNRKFPVTFYTDEEYESEVGLSKTEKTPEEIAKQKKNRIVMASLGMAAVLFLVIFRPFAPTVYVYPTPTEGEMFSLVDDTATPTIEANETEIVRVFSTPTPGVSYTATPQYVSTQRSDDYYRLAMNSIKNDEWEEAIFYLDILTKTEDYIADIYYLMGQAYEMDGDYKNAYSHYGLAVKEDTLFGPGYLGIGRMEMELYSTTSAKDNLDKALKYSPEFIDVYLVRADYFYRLGLYSKALEELNDAEDISDDNGSIYLKRAEIYYEQREYNKALDQAEIAHDYFYRLSKDSPLLGKIYLALGDGENALILLREYTKANQDDLFGQLDLGLAYLTLEDNDKAIELFEDLVEIKDVRNYAYTYLGRAYMAQGDMDAAIPALSSGAALNPYSYETHYYLAQGYHIIEQSTNGFRSYVSALKQEMTDPERIQVLYDFAIFCEDFDLKDEAERYWEQLGSYSHEELPSTIYDDLVLRYPQYKPTNTPIPTSTKFPTKTPTIVVEALE